VINQPFYFDAVFAVLRPFLKDKIRRRVSDASIDISKAVRRYTDLQFQFALGFVPLTQLLCVLGFMDKNL
jgi:hypothetical protein